MEQRYMMDYDFKSFLIIGFIMLQQIATAQDTSNFIDHRYIDSVQQEIVNELEGQIRGQHQYYENEIQQLMQLNDSLWSEILLLRGKINESGIALENNRQEITALNKEIGWNRATLLKEVDKRRITILIAAPSLLILIGLSIILFFMQLKRSRQSTNQRLNLLETATSQKIDSVRELILTDVHEGILKKIRKRLKRLEILFKQKEKAEYKAGKKKKKKK